MRKFFALLTIIVLQPAIRAFSQDVPRPDLKPVERMTTQFLSTPDFAQLSHDAPLWAPAVEDYLSLASDSAIEAFRPSGMTRFDLDGSTKVWCGTWSRGGRSRLIWFAVSGVCVPQGGLTDDALRRAVAYVDDIGSQDTSFSVSLFAKEGLQGIGVYNASAKDDNPLFFVPDVESRIALRILTNINFSDDEKTLAEAFIRKRLKNAANTLAADLAGFPELTFCDSPDNALRTVTYMVSNFDFSSRCGGWILSRPKRGNPIARQLVDATDRIGQPEQATLNPSSWYGAIYSSIIQFRYNKADYYALLGFKGATPTVKTRVIDVVRITGEGKFAFGAKVFRHPYNTYRRRIFQYSAKASMTIRYDDNSQIIVLDHLEPSQRIMAGQPEYYGPDLSYDAYVLSDKGWEFQSDIQVTEEDGAQANPDQGPTASDDFELSQSDRRGSNSRSVSVGSQQPSVRKQRKKSSSSSSSWSGRSSQSSKRNKQSSTSSWFDKGKGNSAPNIRSRR